MPVCSFNASKNDNIVFREKYISKCYMSSVRKYIRDQPKGLMGLRGREWGVWTSEKSYKLIDFSQWKTHFIINSKRAHSNNITAVGRGIFLGYWWRGLKKLWTVLLSQNYFWQSARENLTEIKELEMTLCIVWRRCSGMRASKSLRFVSYRSLSLSRCELRQFEIIKIIDREAPLLIAFQLSHNCVTFIAVENGLFSLF